MGYRVLIETGVASDTAKCYNPRQRGSLDPGVFEVLHDLSEFTETVREIQVPKVIQPETIVLKKLDQRSYMVALKLAAVHFGLS